MCIVLHFENPRCGAHASRVAEQTRRMLASTERMSAYSYKKQRRRMTGNRNGFSDAPSMLNRSRNVNVLSGLGWRLLYRRVAHLRRSWSPFTGSICLIPIHVPKRRKGQSGPISITLTQWFKVSTVSDIDCSAPSMLDQVASSGHCELQTTTLRKTQGLGGPWFLTGWRGCSKQGRVSMTFDSSQRSISTAVAVCGQGLNGIRRTV